MANKEINIIGIFFLLGTAVGYACFGVMFELPLYLTVFLSMASGALYLAICTAETQGNKTKMIIKFFIFALFLGLEISNPWIGGIMVGIVGGFLLTSLSYVLGRMLFSATEIRYANFVVSLFFAVPAGQDFVEKTLGIHNIAVFFVLGVVLAIVILFVNTIAEIITE